MDVFGMDMVVTCSSGRKLVKSSGLTRSTITKRLMKPISGCFDRTDGESASFGSVQSEAGIVTGLKMFCKCVQTGFGRTILFMKSRPIPVQSTDKPGKNTNAKGISFFIL
jgi:hypothetical protein